MEPYVWGIIVLFAIVVTCLFIVHHKKSKQQPEPKVCCFSPDVSVNGTKREMQIVVDGIYEFVSKDGRIMECKNKKTGKIVTYCAKK